MNLRLIAKCNACEKIEVVPVLGLDRAWATTICEMVETTMRLNGCGYCSSKDVDACIRGYAIGERVRLKASGRAARVRDVTPDRVIVEYSIVVGHTVGGDEVVRGPVRVESYDEDDIELIPALFEPRSLVRVDDDRVGRVEQRMGTAHVVVFDDGERAYVDGSKLSQEL